MKKNRQNIKEFQKEVKPKKKRFHFYMQKKLAWLFIIILLIFVGLGVRLIWITQEKGTQYNKEILQQQRYDSTTLPYKRGSIVDSKGTVLAVSEKYYNLVLDAEIINFKDEYFEPTMNALEANFELNMEDVRSYVRTYKESNYYVAKKLISYEEKLSFESAVADNDFVQGVWFEETYKRVYPQSTLACDVIGFAGNNNVGKFGLEEYYNDILNGTTGREYGYLAADSTLERTIKPAVDGYTIHTTIDANIQSIMEKYLYQFNEKYKNNYRTGNGAENVGAILMEIDSGEILGMASYPNYDLNHVEDTSALLGSVMIDEENKRTGTYITQEVLDSMGDDLLNKNLYKLWENFCITEIYEPGSTIKPFTVATALEVGAITGNESYYCGGKLHIGDHDIHCHIRTGDGWVSVQDSIAWSCNVALMEIGQAIGKTNFAKFQQAFNFGLKTNIDLAGERRTVDYVHDENMGDADLATNTFGQNFNTTMIQVIAGYCSLINGGYYYEPHMVDKITNSDGAIVQNIEPRVLKQTVSESTSEKIRQYCRAVVMEEGGSRRTGKTARPAGYAIGGKTGTAQTYPRGNDEYVVSFIGYAPADDPQIAIYVVVDRANAKEQDDAKFATTICRNILTEVLPYLNIYMTEELSETEKAELEALQIEIIGKKEEVLEEEAVQQIQEDTGDTQEPTNTQPDWMNYPIDEATGYLKDPVTGELLDPETGDLINGNLPAITW